MKRLIVNKTYCFISLFLLPTKVFSYPIFLLLFLFGVLATQAQEKIDSLKTRLNHTLSENEKFFVFRELGIAYNAVNGDSAIYFSNKAYQIGLGKENKELQMLALIIRGNSYLNIDNPELALKDYFQCKALAEELKNEEYIQKSLSNIANIYKDLGDHKEALEYYGNALEVARRIEDKRFEGVVLNNLGTTEGNIGNYHKALEYLYQAEGIYKETGKEILLSQTWINIGHYLQKTENFEGALKYFMQARELSGQLNQIQDEIKILNNIGELYMVTGHNSEAEKYLREAFQLNRKGRYATQMLRTHHILSIIAAGLKKTDSVSKSYYRTVYMSDSLNKILFNKKIADLRVRYETVQKEQQIEQLRLEKNLRSTIIGVLILTTALLVILYFVKKQKSRTELDLLKKNLEAVELDKRIEQNEPGKNIVLPAGSEPGKYKNSTLSPELRLKLVSDIRFQLENEKIYLQCDLTLDKLCEVIRSNKTYVSQILNEEYGKSFSTLINEFRVKEVRRRLADAKYDNYSIEGLALDAGFSSGNRFHKVFKKFTGLTPAQFKKLLEKEQSKFF